jgi:hypothetical protein
MHSFRKAKRGWTTDDQTAFVRWSKVVCAFYGALFLMLFAGLSVQIMDHVQTKTTAAITSIPTTP